MRIYWKDEAAWFPGIVAAYNATRAERRHPRPFALIVVAVNFSLFISFAFHRVSRSQLAGLVARRWLLREDPCGEGSAKFARDARREDLDSQILIPSLLNAMPPRVRFQWRYLVFYDDCEFEWVAIAGPGPAERVQFHRDAPTFQMITELNMRVNYMQMVKRMQFISPMRYPSCAIVILRLEHTLKADTVSY